MNHSTKSELWLSHCYRDSLCCLLHDAPTLICHILPWQWPDLCIHQQTCVFELQTNPAPLSHSRDSLCFLQMLHGTVSCFTSLLSSFLPSFWLDLLQVSRHSCVFELPASFPLGCCVPPANPSSQQAASASGCPALRSY